ncbi:ATP-dependent zinc metalloprotease FtsH [Patescibacteria group bacterium]
MKNLAKNLTVAVLALILIASIFTLIQTTGTQPEEISLSRVAEEIKADEIDSILVEGETVTVILNDENATEQVAQKEFEASFTESIERFGVDTETLAGLEIEIKDESGFGYWMGAILPFLIPFLIIGVFVWLMFRSASGMNRKAMSFGQSKAREVAPTRKKKITFKNVAGMKEAKEEVMEVVDFLKHPSKFAALGAEVPKGVLLLGPPGTGKTLLAQAVAGEASVPYFHISGSEFVEMFVGVGASRVRDLFRKAKKAAPAIIFIDEIDAVGRQRGAGLGGSHDEREQTLNQILVEMDGFDTNTNVIVIAATNRPDVLDPALLRPGRFDRRIIINKPDIEERDAILKVHAKNKPIEPDVDMHKVAQRTPGFSGADLRNLLNESAIRAARRGSKTVNTEDILESIEKVMLGPERKSRVMDEKETKITAYHEAGHALVARMLPNTDPVSKVSIIARGMAGGYTLNVPEKDRHYHSRTEFNEQISVTLAGHATEKKIFGDVTTGASDDLRKASELARKLVTEFGMSDKLGPMTFGEKDELVFLGKDIASQRNYSEEVAAKIDDEVSKIIHANYKVAKDILDKHGDKLEEISQALLKKETMEQEDFEKFFKDYADAPKKVVKPRSVSKDKK